MIRNNPVEAFATKLLSALEATKSWPCCMARNTYAGPADTGRLAIKAPHIGPSASAATEAETTSRAVVRALTSGGNHSVAVIGYDLPPAGRFIRAALRQDSVAGCRSKRLDT